IWGITKDIDGEPRNTVTPDIGADEFVFVPVELTSFTAMVNGKEILLSWTTASELNNLGFEIQRSTGGEEFFTIGFVDGHGTTTEQHNYRFADKKLDNGKYYYRLKQVDFNGTYDYSDIVEVEWRAFNSYLLEQNYPNPFNPTTIIGFGIKEKSHVKITVLNAIGEEVAQLLNEEREPGFHQLEFNANNLPSGVYFCRLQAGTFTEIKKMMLMK
ncbi:MAG: T9SS type A sorting domain-containing protein, partial [Ignavibacteriaceae bacterium]